MDLTKYELAGLLDLENGLLGGSRFHNLDSVPVPWRIWLEDDAVHYEMVGHDFSEWWHEADTRGALGDFISINDANKIVRFARQYGVLGLCKHGLPASHNPRPFALSAGGFTEWWCEPNSPEPIPRWLIYIERARAFMNIAARLRKGPPEPGLEEDWRAVYVERLAEEDSETHERILGLVKALGESIEFGSFYLTFLVNQWLDTAHVRPYLNWHPWEPKQGEPRMTFSGHGIFAALGLQLASAIIGLHGFAQCSGCANIYQRQRRQAKSGQRNYCPTCHSKGVPARDRQRRSRQDRNRRGLG